jgi:hypothetical protein
VHPSGYDARVGLRSASGATHVLFGALLTLVLATRLLTPAGFMPSFEHGAVAIVVCPDAEPAAAPMGHYHHGGEKKLHQPCPYAAGAAAGTLADIFALLATVLVSGAALLLGRAFRFLERHRSRERPPSRGPPLPA